MKRTLAVSTAIILTLVALLTWSESSAEKELAESQSSPPVRTEPTPPTSFSQLPPEVLADLGEALPEANYTFDNGSAWNRPGGFSARYAKNHGMRIRHPSGGWDIRMKLSSANDDAELVEEGDTLYLDHGQGLTERWANGPAGVEHAVLVAGPEALERAVFDLSSPLNAEITAEGRGVEFKDLDGEVAFSYDGYRVIDALGRTLDSELALTRKSSTTWQLALLADDTEARYPLTLDPLMSTSPLRLLVPLSERSEGDLAGYSIAISGDRMVVGAPRIMSGGTAGTARVYHFDQVWRIEATLAPADPVEGEAFGAAVDIWGTRVAVSALGRVLVYELSKNDTTWELLTTLTPMPEIDEVTSLEDFGTSVAVEGNLVFVGAPRATVQTHTNAGAVQAFRLPSESGGIAEVARSFHAPSPQMGGLFGKSISATEGFLAVGAPRMSPTMGAANAGSAFVFAFNPENLNAVSVREADAPADESTARFGDAVSIDEHTLAVGSPQRTWFGASDAGIVDIFKLDSASGHWSWKNNVSAPDGTPGDNFGFSLALSGDTLVVGAPEGDFGGSDPGTAYVFERHQNNASPVIDSWGFAEKIRASGTNSGHSVAASGDHFALGAPSTELFGLDLAGQVNVYTRRSTRWRETILPSTSSSNRRIASIAIDQGFLAVGQPSFGSSGGRVRIGQRNRIGSPYTETWRPSITIDPPVEQDGQEFGATIALQEPWLAVGAPGWNSIETTESGRCYLFLHVDSDWIHVATYERTVPESGDRFGSAISMNDRWLAIGSEGADCVRIYDRLLPDIGLSWGFTQEFQGNTSFGNAVALHPAGNLLAVGTPIFSGGSTQIFELDSTRASDPWVAQVTIGHDAGFASVGSGTSLAFRGDLLAIGEPGYPGGGRVALREWNEGGADQWGIRYTLTVPDAPEDAALGTSVAVTDRFIVAGAPGWASPNSPETSTGAAFVFDPRMGSGTLGGGDITPHHRLIPTGSLDGHLVGRILDADGSEIVIGSADNSNSAITSVYTRQWWAWTPAAPATFGDAGVQNGYAVDIEGDYLAYSAPFDVVDTHPGAGSVRLFKRNRTGTGGWSLARSFFSPDPAISGNFGLSLGFSGNALLVGAPGEDGGEGIGYLFERNEGGPDQWNLSRTFAPPALQPGDDFGAACGIDADTIAIGAPGRAINTGGLFLYGKRLGAAKHWVFHQEIGPPIPGTQAFFARSIAVEGHRVLAGATGSDINVPGSGSAHLYGYTGEDSWGLIRTLLPNSQQTGSLFGFSVALDGPYALVGAPRHNHPNGIESGSATLFYRDHGTPNSWDQDHIFYPTAGETVPDDSVRFGEAVALRGRRAAISAPNTSLGITSNAGAIHVFDRNGTSYEGWDRTSFLTTSDSQPGDRLGRALATGPSTIVAGIPLYDRTSPLLEVDRGRVLLFEETVSSFTTYLASHGLSTNADPLGDPDNDGLTTLEEAYLNSDPTVASQGFQATAVIQQGRPTLSWREGKETNGTVSRILISTDLLNWTSPNSLNPRTIREDATTITRQVTLLNNPAPQSLFFRVEISRP